MIDDDRKLCRLVSTYLEPLGFEVTCVHTGPEGVERAVAADAHWHAVLLDVMLPGLDGFEVLRRIRAQRTVPVLMLTARGDETDRIVGLEVGADDYLPKTFSTRELLARLRAVIRRSAFPLPHPAPGRRRRRRKSWWDLCASTSTPAPPCWAPRRWCSHPSSSTCWPVSPKPADA